MDWYVGTEWRSDRQGLRKQVLDIKFKQLQKPTEVAKVVLTVRKFQQPNGRPRSSAYLNSDAIEKEQLIDIGSALTPVDCYVEKILLQMIVGETAQCFIETKCPAEEISFVATLERIVEQRQLFKLNVNEMYQLAQRYKENGVTMFRKYPLFAHQYFARAAKFLISYSPFHALTVKNDGVDGKDMDALLINIRTNLAACLLQQKRYDHVLYQTEFVETMKKPTDKSCYRRAVAFYNTKEFEAALKTIEKVPNYQEKKDFVKLHASIRASYKTSNTNYKNLVQRMFQN